MKIGASINLAYASYCRSPDYTAVSQTPRFDSTREAGEQMQGNQIYRAVEGLPPHQAGLLRLCFTESGTEHDTLKVYQKLLVDFDKSEPLAAMPAKRIAQVSAIAYLAVLNFRRLALTNTDQFSTKAFADMAGVGIQHYKDVLLHHQKQMEMILVGYLGNGLDPVKRILKHR